MEVVEFLLDHWEALIAFIVGVINLVITLCVHGKSSTKIEKLDWNNTQVGSALLSVVNLAKELQNEIETFKGSKDLQKDGQQNQKG
ncbi:hypothetical protein [Capybara microvirus Cap1_SP_133]|nr:hypothetical protein [Capybara microvirus Cap1_SP_133]